MMEYNLKEKCEVQSSIHTDSKLVFPEFYFKEIILDTIVNNLRHRNKTKDPVIIKVYDSSDNRYIIFEIVNDVNPDSKPGSGYGSVLIDFANSFPRKGFQYDSNKIDNSFHQKFRIKKV